MSLNSSSCTEKSLILHKGSMVPNLLIDMACEHQLQSTLIFSTYRCQQQDSRAFCKISCLFFSFYLNYPWKDCQRNFAICTIFGEIVLQFFPILNQHIDMENLLASSLNVNISKISKLANKLWQTSLISHVFITTSLPALGLGNSSHSSANICLW